MSIITYTAVISVEALNIYYDPIEYSQSTVILTKLYDFIIIMISIVLSLNILIQSMSLSRVNQFLTKSTWSRVLFKLLLLTMAVLYANNVFLMLAYSWGTPAKEMT